MAEVEQFCTAFGCHGEGLGGRKGIGTVADTLKQHRLTNFSKHVGTVIACTSIDGNRNIDAHVKHLLDPADAAAQSHVRGRTMGDVRLGLLKNLQFLIIEVDAMGIPYILSDQAALLHKLQRSHAVHFLAEVCLVVCLTQVGVEPNPILAAKCCSVLHQALGYAERTAGGECNLVHGIGGSVMVCLDAALTVTQNFIFSLNDTVGRKPSILLAQAHRTAGRTEPHAQSIGSLELQPHQIPFERSGVEIVMVGGKRASGFHQLGHGQKRGVIDCILIDIFPNLIEEFQPIKKLCILHSGVVAGKCLVKMVVGVHQTGNHHMLGTINCTYFPCSLQVPDRGDGLYLVPYNQQIGSMVLGTIERGLEAVNIFQ
ncbi:hypothetical protein DSECCO2_649310 [anaerobic digester metagenome]